MKTKSAFLFCTYLLWAAFHVCGASVNFNKVLAGNGADAVNAMASDSQGNMYITGSTSSTDFPASTNALQPNLLGASDAFVAKLDPSGNILFATYLGGTFTDTGTGIALDTNGNIYVTGYTISTNFPVNNAYRNTNSGNNDIFVTKLSPDGHTIIYSTYVGGKDYDTAGGIAVDANGNATVTGYTQSTNFPTLNALQPTFGGIGDAFVFKLNSSGNNLVYSTYLGGSGQENRNNSDLGGAVAIDSAGNAYITGWTYSTNFPVLNALQPTKPFTAVGVYTAAFLTKINPNGTLLYSSYYGGNGLGRGYGLGIDANNHVYLAGSTSAYDFPITNAFQPYYGGAGAGGYGDGFVAAFDSTLTNVLYATYVGGRADERALGLAVAADGTVAVTGFTESFDFPLTNALSAGNHSLFISTNAGTNWTAASSGIVGSVHALQVDPFNSAIIYAVTDSGFFKSYDNGATWTRMNYGVDFAVVADPVNQNTIYYAAYDGVYKSTDGGTNWTQMITGLPGAGYPDTEALAIDPTTPTTLYVGTYSGGVYKTVDGGNTWVQRTNGLSVLRVKSLAVNPQNPQMVYVGTSSFGAINLFSSSNGGTNWTRATGLSIGDGASIVLKPGTPSSIYAITQPSTGANFNRSIDNGVTWSNVQQTASSFKFNTAAIPPQSPSTIYIGTDSSSGYGLLRSTDGGATMTSVGLAGDNITALAFPANNANVIYAGTDGSRDAFITVLDSAGALKFSSPIGGTGLDEGHAIVQTTGGNVLMGGLSSSSDYVVKLQGSIRPRSITQNTGSQDSVITSVKTTSDCTFELAVTVMDLGTGATNGGVVLGDPYVVFFNAVVNGEDQLVDSITPDASLLQNASAEGNRINGFARTAGTLTGNVTARYHGCVVTVPVTVTIVQAYGVMHPDINGFTPLQGGFGDTVQITGANFQNATSVTLNGTSCNFQIITPSICLMDVAQNATTGKVSITTPQGTAVSVGNLVVKSDCFGMIWSTERRDLFGPRVLDSVFKTKTYNTKVGERFSLFFQKVSFPGNLNVDSISVQGTLPPGLFIDGDSLTGTLTQAGTYTFTVTGQSGQNCSSSETITVNVAQSVLPPTFTSFTPAGGIAGDSVLITGSGFDATTSCLFNGTRSTFVQVIDPTQLLARVPLHSSSGSITINTLYGSCMSSNPFIVIQDCFTLGWTVTIDGHPVLRSSDPEVVAEVGSNVSIGFADDLGELNPLNSITVHGALPPGLSVSEGQLTGTLTQGGTYQFTVTGSRPDGCTASVNMVMKIADGTTSPNIVTFDPDCGYYGDCISVQGSGFSSALAFYINDQICSNVRIVNSQVAVIDIPFLATTGPIRINNVFGDATSTKTLEVRIPKLKTLYTPGNLQLSWHVSTPPFVLQSTPSLTAPNWLNFIPSPTLSGDWYIQNVPVTGGSQFLRLEAQ